MKEKIEAVLREAAELHAQMAERSDEVRRAADRLVQVLSGGGTVYVMGNGGSAADAQHLAGELVGRFLKERRALPCVALSTDTSVLTAVANDYGVEEMFARQVRGLVGERDAVIGISTSGGSANVVAAARAARQQGAATIALTGADGGPLAEQCDLAVRMPSRHTPRIQELHNTVIHLLCELVEDNLFGP